MIDRAGAYNLPMAEYLADPCPTPSLNHAVAQILLTQSPRHAWHAHPQLNPLYQPEHREAFDIGTAVHALVLEGQDSFAIIQAENWKTKEAQLARVRARTAGLTPLLAHQWVEVQMLQVALATQAARYPDPKPLHDGRPELTLVWQEGPIWCRARLDWLHTGERLIEDLKTTTESAHPAEWSRKLFDRGYDLQAAFQLRGAAQVLADRVEHRFVVIETQAPYGMSVMGLDPEALHFARQRFDEAVRLWTECLAQDQWPGYPAREATAEVPPYVKARFLERAYYQ